MSLDHLGSHLSCATDNFFPVCAVCTHCQRTSSDGLGYIIVRIKGLGLEPAAPQAKLVGEGVQFVQRIGNQVAPFTATPLDSLCINIDRHGARLEQKNVQIFCTQLAKNSIEMNASDLGRSIKAARRQRGFTLKYLQQSTGVHYTQISKMERGGCKLLSKNLLIICNFLHISYVQDSQPVSSESVVDRVQALIHSWPQSEGVIRHFLEGVEMALEGGCLTDGHGQRLP